MLRSPNKDIPEAIQGDFNDPVSISKALQGIEKAFLLTNSSEQAENQQITFVELAKKAGVKHIVKLSQWAADKYSPVRFLRYHAAVEDKIRESGLTYTFLRPNLFMQGLLGFKEPIKQGKFFAAVGNARISAVDIRDIADVAAVALTQPGHENKIYNLTGPEAITHYQMAEELSKALNKQIIFIDVPPAAMKDAVLQVGFPEWQADGLIEDYAHYAKEEAASIESGIIDATGKPPRSFADFARDYAPAFA
ncbi:SDR family oxidoreductase [Chitinophaga oryziterrae]